jgi:hypothetical protein
VAWSGLQTAFLERAPETKASADPSTKNGIEPVRLGASLFRARPLDRHSVMLFPVSVNNPGLARGKFLS